MDENGQEGFERVHERIAWAVQRFCDGRREKTPRFHMDELRTFVMQNVGIVAPDSPGRILRAMRNRGEVNYNVVSRRESLYEVM